MNEFHRIRRLPPYVFEQVNKIKAKARAAGADIIDLGMGNPDLPAEACDREAGGKQQASRATIGTPLPRASVAFAARRPAITSAASA